MSKKQVLMILGAWVALLSFLGFPPNWDVFFMVASGVLIVCVAYSMRQKTKPVASTDMPYVEHRTDGQTRS